MQCFRAKNLQVEDENAMDVDEGDEKEASTEEDSDSEDDEGDSMSVDNRKEVSSLKERAGHETANIEAQTTRIRVEFRSARPGAASSFCPRNR